MCFKWAILSAIHPIQRNDTPKRVSKYKIYEDELNFNGIDFPVKVSDITTFETQNNISITLIGWEDNQPFPIRIPHQRFEKHVTLLLYSDDKTSHYVWVKSLNKLLASTKTRHCQHFCDFCFQGFTKKRFLEDHVPNCMVNGPQKVKLPSEDNKWLKFTDVQKQLKVPIIIYADFETFNRKIDTCIPDPNTSSTTRLTHQTPSGFAYKIVGLTEAYSKPIQVYRGVDATDVFVKHILEEQMCIRKLFKHYKYNPTQMNMTEQEKIHFKQQRNCHICDRAMGNDRRRDHCHITGVYRGAAHNECNLNYKFKGQIPVVFHNLRSYDAHLIMQAVGSLSTKIPIQCIPNTDEKYISFSLGMGNGRLNFIDSAQFTANASLETLVGNLTADQFHHLKEITRNDEQLSLLRQKGGLPIRLYGFRR